MSNRQKVVVVGAEIIGAAIAYRMAQAGAGVTVLDAGLPAGRASGASFGWINASFFANPDHFRLREAGIAAHRTLDAELGTTGTIWAGALWWEETGPGFDVLAKTLAALGYPLREVSQAEFVRTEPNIANPPARCLSFASEGAADTAELTERLLQGAAVFGAQTWLGCAVTAFCKVGAKVTGVKTDQGDIAADHVILAAGTATEQLLAPLGIALPMLRRPGMVVQTRPVPPMIRHILVSPDGELRQDGQGRIIAPTAVSHQGDTCDAITELPGQAAEAALDRLRAQLPGADLKIDRVLLAHRPVPLDGLPVVGPTGLAGLYVAVMHSGVTLGPLVGELVADEVLQGAASPLLTSFRPDRFAL